MRYTLLRAAVSALLLFVSQAALALELATEDDAPHNMEKNGKVVGIATEKLEIAFQRVGASQRIEMMPWARAYQSALNLPGHCAFSAARTSEREALFRWIGPIAAMDWVLYMRADNPAKPGKLEDVRNQTIGGYLQDVISVWLAAHGYRVDTAPNDQVNPKKLLLGRTDYWASSRPRASAMLAKEDLATRIVPALTFGHTDLYLACHRSTASDLVEKLNAALQRMTEDGTSARIEARYAGWPAAGR